MSLINVYLRTNQADVVIFLLAFIPDFLKINTVTEVTEICGVGTHKYCMSVNVIAESITLERCK